MIDVPLIAYPHSLLIHTPTNTVQLAAGHKVPVMVVEVACSQTTASLQQVGWDNLLVTFGWLVDNDCIAFIYTCE